MNRVHEQCPKIDSETVLSQTGPKTGRMHQVHSHGQPASPGSAPSTGAARTSRAPAAPVVARPLSPRARAPPACTPARPAACRACPMRAPSPCLRLLRASRACCMPQRLPTPCRGLVTVLQYSPCPTSVIIQSIVLRYKFSPTIQSCNTLPYS